MADTLDAPSNTITTAGLGMEFETGLLQFESENCPDAERYSAKGALITGHSGTNWELTADISDKGNRLNPEYILNGKQIKIGHDDAANAAAGAAAGKRNHPFFF